MSDLPTELIALASSVVLLIAQILLQAFTMTSEVGLAYNASARDEARPVRGVVAGRAERALRNLLETYPAFVALALMLAITGRTGGLGAAGAWLWLIARVIYVPLYLIGAPFVRSVAWAAALVGLGLMLMRFMTFAPAM
ncbi:MAG: MAPEG family protein [Rhodoblastus sp.]|nr:MAG: MAPEG family protein [Rhodoblastus sp.]